MTMPFVVLAMLTIKHFIFDFAYQPPYMWQNKGTYGHPGGLIHSGLHVVATFVILIAFVPSLVSIFLAICFEFIVHYHMDWFKMWYNKRQGWTAVTHHEFWVLTGLDQFVHSMTYIILVLGVMV